MDVNKKIILSIGYYDFEFDYLPEANMFAEIAARALTDKSRCVEMKITYEPAAHNEEEE